MARIVPDPAPATGVSAAARSHCARAGCRPDPTNRLRRIRPVAARFGSSALAVVLATGLLRCGPAAADAFDCGVAAPGDRPAVVATRLAGVPAILRIPRVIGKAPIVLWHGFGPPAGERALMAALPLDEVPAVKVYLGLPLFGARSPPGGTDEMIRRQTRDVATLVFEPVVMGAARELPRVVRALRRRHCMAQDQKIGLFGFSAGGAAVLVALARRQPVVGRAVTLNASTGLDASIAAFEHATGQSYRWTPRARSLARRSDAVIHAADIAAGHPPVALLLIQGADDGTVSPAAAVRLHDALTPYYRRDHAQSRLRLTVIPRLSHAWAAPRADARLEREIASWFNRYSS